MSDAKRQDPALVRAVFDYRNARLAVEWMNEGAEGMQRLQAHPQLVELLKDMMDAQGTIEVQP